MIMRVGAADMNDAGVRQILGEDVEYVLARILVQGIEHFVDEYPGRRVQHHAGESQCLLFVLAQFPIPAMSDVQHGYQAF